MANLGSDLGNAAGAHPESGNKDHEISSLLSGVAALPGQADHPIAGVAPGHMGQGTGASNPPNNRSEHSLEMVLVPPVEAPHE